MTLTTQLPPTVNAGTAHNSKDLPSLLGRLQNHGIDARHRGRRIRIKLGDFQRAQTLLSQSPARVLLAPPPEQQSGPKVEWGLVLILVSVILAIGGAFVLIDGLALLVGITFVMPVFVGCGYLFIGGGFGYPN